MTTLLQILLYSWIAITATMIVTWYLRRRLAKAKRKAHDGGPKMPLNDTEDGENRLDRLDESDVQEDEENLEVDPDRVVVGTGAQSSWSSEEDMDGSMGTVTADTIEFDPFAETDSKNARESLSELTVASPRSLIDMLDGIELPYDLTPVTTAVEDPDRHLIFLTTHSNAEEVGTRFADELIRIGYEFSPVGLDQAVAVRGDDTVSMTIVPKASEVTNGNVARYGAAGVGDVALEVWIGQSSTPPRTPFVF